MELYGSGAKWERSSGCIEKWQRRKMVAEQQACQRHRSTAGAGTPALGCQSESAPLGANPASSWPTH